MEYPYICKKCGLVRVFSNSRPNRPVENDQLRYLSKLCEFCSYPIISTDRDIDEYAKEYERLTGIKITINNEHLLHPMIEQDYITRHPEEFDENLYLARLKRQNEVLSQREAEKNLPHCPKCRSTSIITQKQGFGIGKAAAGVILTGGLLGAAAGGINANKNWNVCQKCGHKWKI